MKQDLCIKSEGTCMETTHNITLTTNNRVSNCWRIGIVLLLLLVILIPSAMAVDTLTKQSATQQVSFPTITSTNVLLQAMGSSQSGQIFISAEGSDGSTGTACSLNKQSGGALQRISPQEETEKILAVKEYIKKNNLSWTAGKTSVSNLTPAAYATLRGLKHPATGESYPVRSIKSTASLSRTTLPASFDWRDNGGNWLTPIKNQGCGDCWAFGSTATFESFWKRIHNTSDINPDFAEQYLVSCDSEDYGCNGGNNPALGYFVNKTDSSGGVGTVVESDYPYTGTDTTCKDLTGKTRYAVPTGGSWSYLAGDTVIDSVDNTKQAIYSYGPVSAYIYATDNFSYYTGGIYEEPGYTPLPTNHVINIVGWGHDPIKNKDYWIGKNSWGTTWGESGWFRIYTDQCSIGEGVAYLAYSGSIVPVAYFTASPTYGTAPLTVKFTDSSTNTPISWNWSFGDGSLTNATVQNPVHTYVSANNYTIALTATNSAGSNTFTRTNYITVTSGGSAPTVGVFRGSNGAFYLASSNTPGGGTVNAFNFGMNGDVPVVVDNHVGVFRNSTGTFYLASSNTAGGGTVTAFNFGVNGDIPLVVNNVVGVFRPSTGVFYLASSNTPGGGTVNAFNFGMNGDIPLVVNNVVGVFRPSNGVFYLASSNTPGGGTVNAFNFGMNGDLPVVVDNHVGVFRPSTGVFYLASSNTAGGGTVTAFNYGMNGDQPIAAAWA